MTTLNDFFPQLGTQDTKKKLSLGAEIISHLEKQKTIDCEDLGAFIDSIVVWLNSSNFKVALNGLEILVHFVDKLGENFRLYISTVLPHVIDRLGDNKDQVREQAQLLIQKLMNQVSSPQAIFDKLPSAFTHKNGRVRQEVLITLQTILQQHGAQALSLSKLVPFIAKLLGDPTAYVRDEAVNTLVEIYRHVGERVRVDLAKKYNVPAPKLQIIFAKFDELREGGELMPTALVSGASSTTSSVDGGYLNTEVDRDLGLNKSPAKNRASSAPPTRRALFTLPTKPAPLPMATATPIQNPASTLPRKRSFRTTTTSAPISAGQAGAVDEETFIRSFEDVPKIEFFSPRELEGQLHQIKDTLADTNTDWERRIDNLKKLRSLVVAGAASYDEFYPCLRLLEQPFQTSVKDLRSQVVREACITIAYLSQQLQSRLDHFSEALFPALINLIPNSAKVMATAGIVAIRFVIRYTYASRLVPIITGNLSSKSKDIRKAMCEFLDQLLHTWPTHSLERHIAIIQEAIKKGISDADSEARASSRKAFWGFHDHFKEQGDSLLQSLESSKQKMLQGEFSLSSSSSNNSLQGLTFKTPRPKASSTAGSTENLNRVGSFHRRTGIPVPGGRSDAEGAFVRQNGSTTPMRSNSAIDVNAAQRARARQAYAAAARLKVGSVASLPRPMRKVKEQQAVSSAITSPERITRSRNKTGTSQSQPGSRSVSPSSRLSYSTYTGVHAVDGHKMIGAVGRGHVSNVTKRVPRSTGTSRETSPNRQLYLAGRERRLSGSQKRNPITPNSSLRNRSFGSAPSTSPHFTATSPLMAQRILLQSQEAEAAMADALRVSSANARGTVDAFGNESDDSETSSVCSERSYSSVGNRSGNLLNWHSSLPRVWTNGTNWEFVGQDVNEVIQNLSSQNWSERKDGLYGLQCLLQSHRQLIPTELKRVTDCFTKMFMDPHTKLFTLFLDTLNELIVTHRALLHDWLYVLLARLFIKQGSDILGSVLAKILRTLEIIRESFPFDHQFQTVAHFLNDQALTPNLKVKLAALTYLQALSLLMDGSDVRSSIDSNAAFTKIVSWTCDPKSLELRKAAQGVLFAYFSLNTPEITKLLNQLPPNLQDNAFSLIQNMVVNPPSPMAQRLYTPNTVPRPRQPIVSPGPVDTENMNPEDIYVSLRETSAEIQNYSFDGLSPSFTKEKRDLDRDTTSQDSGISQMSVVDGKVETGEERYLNSPEDRSPGSKKDMTPNNGIGHNMYSASIFNSTLNSSLSIEDCLAVVSDKNRSSAERKKYLLHVSDTASTGSEEIWDNNFRLILRTLLDALEDADSPVRAQSLLVLCEVLRHQTFRFQGFTELTILKVLNAQKDSDKEVLRAAEVCATALAEALTVEQSVKVMNPIILTGDFPVNQAAVKMLTKVIEQHSKEEVENVVAAVMPGLLKAYNSPESSLRKSSVFCMVSLHSCVGEMLKPYLSELNGSKMKLLNVYIKRAQSQQLPGSQTSSSPGSPKSTPVFRQQE